MSNRPINFIAKGKRLRQLALTIFLSFAAPITAVIHNYLATGLMPRGWAGFFASHSELLVMSTVLVLVTVVKELIKKQKKPWIKEIIATTCIVYVVVATGTFAYLQANPIETMQDFYNAANIVREGYFTGVVISVVCILAGKS